MVVLCRILVNKPENGAFRAGDIVGGTVKYHLDKPMRFEDISVSLIGEGFASWPTSEESDYAYDKQEYLSLNRNILQASQNDTVLLDQGSYSSTFNFVIPENIPSTFKHTSCNIIYKILVNFKTTNLFNSSKNFDIEIPVFGSISPNSPEPMTLTLKKEIFSFGIGPNKVKILVEIERTFLIAGENINLFLIINNDSNVKISKIKTELVRQFSLVIKKIKKPFHIEPLKGSVKRTASVNKCGVIHMTCMVPTSSDWYSVQHTRKVVIEYKVKITAKFPFPHKNVFLEIPVVIGRSEDVKMYRKIKDCY